MRFLILLLVSLPAFALPKITVEKINGFEVHFVDIGSGNTIGISHQVPFGTMHDADRTMGRAHLLEHVMHIGTVKHPGYDTFNDKLLKAGIDTNAFTAWDKTFYFASAQQDQAPLLFDVFLSMLNGLEFNPQSYKNEVGNVVNEIVEENMVKENYAVSEMSFSQLLPAGHPWATPLLGNRHFLENMSIADLKDLYNQVYRPGIVKLAVHGNFTDPAFKDEVRSLIAKNLRAPYTMKAKIPLAKDLNKRPIRSMFSETNAPPESEKRIYVHTPNFSGGVITLEATNPGARENAAALAIFREYLDSDLPGSLNFHLKNELGWINMAGGYTADIRERRLLEFFYATNEAGRERATEINEIFFRALRDIQENGIPADFLERSKKSMLTNLELSATAVESFLPEYGEVIHSGKSLSLLTDEIAKVTVNDVRAIAQSFRPDLALYLEYGNEVPEMVYDSDFERRFKLLDNRAALARYVAVMTSPSQLRLDPKVKPVDLGPISDPAPSISVRSRDPAKGANQFAFDLRPGLGGQTARVDFVFPALSSEDFVALDLYLRALAERLSAEIKYIDPTYGVQLDTDRAINQLTVRATSTNSYAARALNWYLKKMTSFIPSSEEVARARDLYRYGLMSKYANGFTAFAAVDRLRMSVDPIHANDIRKREIAAGLDKAKVRAAWERLVSRAQVVVTAAGALPTDDLLKTQTLARTIAPTPLSPDDLAGNANRFGWQEGERAEKFPIKMSPVNYGMARIYKGPRVTDLKEAAAFNALGIYLGNEVYNVNRSGQKLGYVHNGRSTSFGSESLYMMVYGGTLGDANAQKTFAGWGSIFEDLRSGKATDEKLNDAIESFRNTLSQEQTSAQGVAAEYSEYIRSHGNPRQRNKMIAAAEALTARDLRESARKYLLESQTPYAQLTLNGCEDELKP